MRPHMKLRLILAAGLLTAAAYAQTAQSSAPAPQQNPQKEELPSAPSATPKAFPGAKPQEQQPSTPAPTQSAPSTTPSSAPAKPPADTSSDDVPIPAQANPGDASKPGQNTAPSNPSQTPQQGSEVGKNEAGEYSYVKIVNEVNTVFTVTDKHGHFVKDLKQADFKIVDDGKPPAEIRYFTSETGLPLRVGLLIDASNSIRDRFRFEQESAIEFLNQIVRRNSDEAFVIGFD